MPRVLVFVGLALVALVLGAAAAGWLAYGSRAPQRGDRTLPGLSAPVTIRFEDGLAIDAATLTDLAAGLGYAHAAGQAWPMLWLRQSARGSASLWLGDSLRAADAHARRLGFDAVARDAYLALPAADRALYDAYARGVNRALAEPGVAQGDAFVVLGIEPEPWEPWDALAVERVVAWAGTPAPGADASWAAARAASPAVRAFARADSAFRAGLGLGGMEHGRILAAATRDGLTLVQHHALGTTADPLVVPARLTANGRTTAALTVPGTLLIPGGRAADRAWGVLLTSRVALAPLAGEAPPPQYSRVVERNGDERLVGARRDTLRLVLGRVPATRRPRPASGMLRALSPPPSRPSIPASRRPAPVGAPAIAPPDSSARRAPRSAWELRWPGFSRAADGPASFRQLAGRAPVWKLGTGNGLALAGGAVRVTGTPRVAVVTDSTAFVSDAPASRPAAERLRLLARHHARPATLADDAVSLPAALALPPLLAALGDRDSLATALQEPFSYLASWDGAYTPDAIGATLYSAWDDAHRSVTGRAPDPADSLDVLLLPYTLRLARAALRDRMGRDAAQWRWGRVQLGVAHPVLAHRGGVAARAFHLASGGSSGHPTALRPGPADGTTAGPAVWTAWTTLGDGRLFVRAPRRRGVTEDEIETTLQVRGRTSVVTLEPPPPGARLTLRPS